MATMQNTINISTLNMYPANKTERELVDMYNAGIFQNNLLPSFVYIIILIMTGVPGNILVCYIYHSKFKMAGKHVKRHYKTVTLSTSEIFIIALAYFDLISCTVAMPIELKLLLNYVKFDYPWLCKISRGVSMFCTISTSFVLLAYAVSRFVGIRLRFTNVEITSFHAKFFVFVSVIIAVPLTIPHLIMYGTYKFQIPTGEEGKTCLILNDFAMTKYPLILTICLSTFHLLFDAVFITLYVLISGKVVNSKRSLSTLARDNSSQRRQEQYEMFRKSSALSSSQDENQTCSPSINSPERSREDVFSFEPDTADLNESLGTSYRKSTNGRKTRFLSRKSQWHHRQSTKSMRSDIGVHGRRYRVGRTTFMLFIVTLGFMLTFLPYCVIAIIRSLKPAFYYHQTNVGKAVYQLFLRSYFLSSAINPIIYSFLNQWFRKRCKEILKNLIKCIFCRQLNKK